MTAPLDEAVVQRMLEAASQARGRAHAPYSRFFVGAAALDESGRIHPGCNVENAAYPLGNCAEALAIATLVMAGGREVRALLVVGDGPALVTPCGGCRQRLREFAKPATPVIVASPAGVRARFTLEELLPQSFGPENLA